MIDPFKYISISVPMMVQCFLQKERIYCFAHGNQPLMIFRLVSQSLMLLLCVLEEDISV